MSDFTAPYYIVEPRPTLFLKVYKINDDPYNDLLSTTSDEPRAERYETLEAARRALVEYRPGGVVHSPRILLVEDRLSFTQYTVQEVTP